MRIRLLLTALVSALTLAGCGAGPPAAATDTGPPDISRLAVAFSGPSSDPNILVALSVVAGKVRAYVCDGDGDRVTVGEWFEGTTTSESVDVTSAGGQRLVASFAGGGNATGSVTLAAGPTLRFTLPHDAGPAGVYQAQGTFDGKPYVSRWIVLADGETRGASKRAGVLLAPGPLPDLAPIREGGTTRVFVPGGGDQVVDYLKDWCKIPVT